MASVRYIKFTGVDRRGVARVGSSTVDTPEQLAERLFRLGYRSASITDDGGAEVGAVCRQADNPRRRTWWSRSRNGSHRA